MAVISQFLRAAIASPVEFCVVVAIEALLCRQCRETALLRAVVCYLSRHKVIVVWSTTRHSDLRLECGTTNKKTNAERNMSPQQ